MLAKARCRRQRKRPVRVAALAQGYEFSSLSAIATACRSRRRHRLSRSPISREIEPKGKSEPVRAKTIMVGRVTGRAQ
jgi:hypothetical protein